MGFGNKLIKLRNEGGLTQEDIAYQFNVTRQTVEDWESGKVIPDIDKLSEISNFFNISIEELIDKKRNDYNENYINEEVITEDKNVFKEKNNKIKIFIIVIFIIVILLIGFSKAFTSSIFKNASNIFENINKQNTNITEDANGIFNQALGIFGEIFNKVDEIENEKENVKENFDKTQQIIDKTKNDIKVKSFNGKFELYDGIINGVQVKNLLSEILTSNRKQGRIITVIYENENVTDTEKIKNVITKLESFEDYDSYFKYDENGYIYKVIISKL